MARIMNTEFEYEVWQNMHDTVLIVRSCDTDGFGFFSRKLAGPFPTQEAAENWVVNNIPEDD